MSDPEKSSHLHNHKKDSKQNVNVPFVFFGALSASVALTGPAVLPAEAALKRTQSPLEGLSEKAPKLTLNADGSVEAASVNPAVLPAESSSSQRISQSSLKQDSPSSNDWRVILNEDGTLSVVPADEVPENAAEVTCTADGVCTPVVSAEEETEMTDAASGEDGETTAETSADAATAEDSSAAADSSDSYSPGGYDS